jgi:hypothetical protein
MPVADLVREAARQTAGVGQALAGRFRGASCAFPIGQLLARPPPRAPGLPRDTRTRRMSADNGLTGFSEQ